MLDVTCEECGSEILAISVYKKVERRRIRMGDFCPDCLIFVRYSEDFNKMRVGILEENKERRKHKPKFLKKERRACQKCWENGKVNRTKWTIRKMPKKKHETQHWKCTCKICGDVWQSNTSEEYNYYPEGKKEYERLVNKIPNLLI